MRYRVDDHTQEVLGAGLGGFIDVGGKAQHLRLALAFHVHRNRHERRIVDLDPDLFHRCDQEIIIAVAANDGGEQFDHRLAPDRRAQVVPGAVPGDAHVDVAAEIGIPQVHRRQAFGLGDLPQQVVGFLRATHGVLLEITGR
ncbi:hypothetical protein D9M69_452260 [compost metagenome]